MHRSRSVRQAEVTTDGRNLVSHAGTAMLSELADRTGLTHGLSEAMADCGISWNTHDPGVVLTHLAVAIADGADCLKDIGTLRRQSGLFGKVASVTTAWRAVSKDTGNTARLQRQFRSPVPSRPRAGPNG
ncbi:MAG: transposase [Acidimicrobiales bacterium]